MTNILLIEDDPTIVETLVSAFEFYGFTLETAGDCEHGLKKIDHSPPDVILLDIMLPGASGFDLCKILREKGVSIPIIILSAKTKESDKLLGFELGADDYITKPFSARELIARVKAVLKRWGNQKTSPEIYQVADCQVNLASYVITKGEKEYNLSPKECEILRFFLENPDVVITRNQIIDRVWGDEYFPSLKTVDNFVVKLRSKLELNPQNPQHIITVHGAGYKFRF